MSRQHFQLIADLLRVVEGVTDEQREEIADALAATNDAFDRNRFLIAAGHKMRMGMAEGGATVDPDTQVCVCGHQKFSHDAEGCGACAEDGEHESMYRHPFQGYKNAAGETVYEHMMHEGTALAENVGPGVPAIIGEEGPEAVIPLDDPNAVEVMAEAIEEGTDGEEETAEIEAVAEAAGEIAEAATEVAEASAEVAESAAEIVDAVTEAEEENVEEIADVAEEAIDATEAVVESEEASETVQEAVRSDVPPRKKHWSERKVSELVRRR
jgi:hypothetical protein